MLPHFCWDKTSKVHQNLDILTTINWKQKPKNMRHKTQIPQEVIWKYLRYSAVNVRKLAQTFAYQGKLFYCSFKFPPVSSIRGWVPSIEALSTHHQWFYPIIIILKLELLRTMTEFGKQHCLEKGRRSVSPACHQKRISAINSTTWLHLFLGIVAYWKYLEIRSTSGTEFGDRVFRKTCLLMAFLFFLPWLLIFIPLFANEDVDWYKDALWEGVHM